MGTVVEIFCEDVQHIQLSINVENIYLVKVVVFSDVLFVETGVLIPFYVRSFDQSTQAWLSLYILVGR